jgi:hypothetical protein
LSSHGFQPQKGTQKRETAPVWAKKESGFPLLYCNERPAFFHPHILADVESGLYFHTVKNVIISFL